MPKGFKDYLAEANAVVETCSVQDALRLHTRDGWVFVDVRDGNELQREGKVPGAVHASRGLLEFRIDPTSPMHNEALAPAAELPVVADSILGSRSFEIPGGPMLLAQGRYRREARSQVTSLSGVRITNTEDRRMDIWTAPQAPILGVVLATATVRSERIFASPIPGVPERGPRVMRYELKLLEILQPGASGMETKWD